MSVPNCIVNTAIKKIQNGELKMRTAAEEALVDAGKKPYDQGIDQICEAIGERSLINFDRS